MYVVPWSFANQIQAAWRSHNPELIAGLSLQSYANLPAMLCVIEAHAMETLLPHTTEEPTLWNYCGIRWQYRKFSTCGTISQEHLGKGMPDQSPEEHEREGRQWLRRLWTRRSAKTNGLCQLLTSLLCSPRWQTGLQVNRHCLHLSRSPCRRTEVPANHRGLFAAPAA